MQYYFFENEFSQYMKKTNTRKSHFFAKQTKMDEQDRNLTTQIFQNPHIFSKFLIHCPIKETIWPLVSSSWSKYYNEFYYRDLLEFNFPNHEQLPSINMKKKHNNPKFKNKFLLAYEHFLIPSSDIFNKTNMSLQRFYMIYKETLASEPLRDHPNLPSFTKSFGFSENDDMFHFAEKSNVKIKHLYIRRFTPFIPAPFFSKSSLRNLKSLEVNNYDQSFIFDHHLLEELTLENIHIFDVFSLPNLKRLTVSVVSPVKAYSEIFPISTQIKKINAPNIFLTQKLDHLESFTISDKNFSRSNFFGVPMKKLKIYDRFNFPEEFKKKLNEVNLSMEYVKIIKFLVFHGENIDLERIFHFIDQTKVYDKLKILGKPFSCSQIVQISKCTKHLRVHIVDSEIDIDTTNITLERLDLIYYGTDIKTIVNLVPNFCALKKLSLKLNSEEIRGDATVFADNFTRDVVLGKVYSPKIAKIPFHNAKIHVNYFICIFSATLLLKTCHNVAILNVMIDSNLNEETISDFYEALTHNKVKILRLNCNPGPYLNVFFQKIFQINFRRINIYGSHPSIDLCLKSNNYIFLK